MTKICVFSDSHGCSDYMLQAVGSEEPDCIFFLGDGENDLRRTVRQYPALDVFQVCGNCDRHSTAPVVLRTVVGGKKIFATHGHAYHVKYEENYQTLRYAGLEADAEIVLFGHTHIPYQDNSLGMVLLNPGSISFYRPGYGVIQIENGVITTEIKQIL